MTISENGFVPIVPSRNVVIFPGRTLPLSIGRKKSVAALEKAVEHGNHIIIIAQKDSPTGIKKDEITPEDLYHTGTLCKIDKVRGAADQGGFQVLVTGVARVGVREWRDGDYLAATYSDALDINDTDDGTQTMLVTSAKTLAQEILQLIPADTRQLAELIEGIDDLPVLLHLCAEHLDIPLQKKQEVLETLHLKARALLVLDLMNQQRETLKLQGKIREKLSRKIGKAQREQILREQLKAIREELGDLPEEGDDRDDYKSKIEASGMSDEAKKIALEEAHRLENMGNNSPEAHIIRNYLDLLVALPWNKTTTDTIDLVGARQTLDSDHYGLEKIKARIVQHLAVMKLKKGGRGSILLFVGAPGVGKTSLGQSIAKALGRKFVRVSLGGVRDDAEVRGHRRTYIGAMPGRVIQGIKRAGSNNPVMMLDEIDKLGRGFQGDPAAALLEVLDPEQNSNFIDHYLDTAFDLSKIFFIATANNLDSIPSPLLDRMEVIEVSGYTTAEKLHIAKNHLIGKQLAEHGLTSDQLIIGDDALLRVITHYTREAGVRELQRHLAALCRAATEKVLDSKVSLPVKIDLALVEEFLGSERYQHEIAERVTPPGVVTGLAWTPHGGDILFVEASLMPGNNQLTLTGQLGEVMKESAQIALSLVRSSLAAIVPGFVYEKKDVHIHVPAGAIPKDGPSAGVTMLTTIASLFSGRSVSPKMAMTGEITLRGSVMPVGGIKEKLIAAHRAGIETILLPKRNQKDLRDVPEEVKSQLKIIFVETATEVLKAALDLDITQTQLWQGAFESPKLGTSGEPVITPNLGGDLHRSGNLM